mmetsp:Transcript_32053/g.73571  ORF Transcript_32053/g.73571 Transcript_32053/m.73571 type:complete len:355 (-) Transcript_32053:2-1066(-)
MGRPPFLTGNSRRVRCRTTAAHEERYLLVLTGGALEDGVQRSEEALEGLAVKGQQLAVTGGNDVRSTGLIAEQGQLTEIIPSLVLHHLLLLGALHLGSLGGPLFQDVKLVSRIPLLDDSSAGCMGLNLQPVSHLGPLVAIHPRQQLHLLQEILIQRTLLSSTVGDDVGEGLTVELQELARLTALDAGGAGAVVQEGELSEAVALLASLHKLFFLLTGELLVAIQLTIHDDEHEIPIVTLLDHSLLGPELHGLSCVNHGAHVLLIQGTEHERPSKQLSNLGLGSIILGVDWRSELLLLVPLTVGRSRHGLARARLGLHDETLRQFIHIVVVVVLLFLLLRVLLRPGKEPVHGAIL